MGCNPWNACRYRVPLEQLPDDLFAQADALGLAAAVHGSEYVTVSDPGGSRPRIGRHLHPGRQRDRPHTAMLANEVYDAPPPVSLLDVPHRRRRHFGPPQAAAQEHSEDRTVPHALRSCGIRSVEELLRLLDGKPVPQANTL